MKIRCLRTAFGKRIAFLSIFCFFGLAFFLQGCGESFDVSQLKDGDIIFQNKKSKHDDFLAVVSKSRYNNVGVLFSKDGKWYVLEAVQPVQYTPLHSWVKEGEEHKFTVKRLKDETVMTPEALEKMRQIASDFLGRPFNSLFEWSDKGLYPSQMVWKLYKEALNIELGPLQTLSDYALTDNDVKQKITEKYGKKVPLYEEIVSPDAIYNSALLVTVTEK